MSVLSVEYGDTQSREVQPRGEQAGWLAAGKQIRFRRNVRATLSNLRKKGKKELNEEHQILTPRHPSLKSTRSPSGEAFQKAGIQALPVGDVLS
jgi:hypothetical protein